MNGRILLLLLGPVLAARAATFSADSDRGARLFETLSCVQCHSVNGKGGAIAPDLGRLVDRSFTPASLSATMWNHAPTMWAAMRQREIRPGELDEQAAQDLFAYFYSTRFFEKPGDAARGKALFSTKHCAVCHGLTEAKIPEARPVAQWQTIGHPITLVNAMWDHAATMREQFAKRQLAWPQLTAQDLTDILVYLRNLPAFHFAPAQLDISSGDAGRALFESKGCLRCHTGKLDLPPRLRRATLTEIAVDMWNHEPRMPTVPARLDLEEMRAILSYLWAAEFFADAGNPESGRRVFTAKHCVACHNDPSSGAPQLPAAGRAFTGATMVSALWHHGPRMLDQMKSKGIAWPHFEGAQMSDLIAYLNASGKPK